jgi:molybdopterin-guanine dinucleotide biosynthesis protein A
MNRPKALVDLGGQPLIGYSVAAIRTAGLEPLVVAKPDSQLPPLSCRIVHERARRRHPLAGIVEGLRASAGRPVVVVACDMPFVEPALLGALAALDAPLAVCETGGRVQPFPGRYAPDLVEDLEAALKHGAPLVDAVASLSPRVLDEDELEEFGVPAWLCFSVNDDPGLEAAERELSVRRSARR